MIISRTCQSQEALQNKLCGKCMRAWELRLVVSRGSADADM